MHSTSHEPCDPCEVRDDLKIKAKDIFPSLFLNIFFSPVSIATLHGGLHDAPAGDGGVPEEVQRQEETQGANTHSKIKERCGRCSSTERKTKSVTRRINNIIG